MNLWGGERRERDRWRREKGEKNSFSNPRERKQTKNE
jgi:hypothetical protein